MRLTLIKPPTPEFVYWCFECGKDCSSISEVGYADLDGEAFRPYYCGPCAVKLSRGFTVNMAEEG